MSRIHEALKKAEQERAVVHAVDPAALPVDSAGSVPQRETGAIAPAPEFVSRTTSIAPPQGDFLRFDDLRAHCSHPHWHLDPNVNVFFNSGLNPRGAEQFRTLRSRLYQLRSTQPLRTLLITSPVPGEGKTFVASNLAQAIVRQPDRRALLIDADLRCARLHVPLGAPSSPGLTDYLRGELSEVSITQNSQEGNLCFIPGGNDVPDPSELLSNGRLKTLIDRMKPVFDWIILDSPPCMPVADARILAEVCDGVLMIVRAGSTLSDIAQRACHEFREQNLIGVVLNCAEEPYGYGGQDSYYGYMGTDSKKPVK